MEAFSDRLEGGQGVEIKIFWTWNDNAFYSTMMQLNLLKSFSRVIQLSLQARDRLIKVFICFTLQ